MVSVFVQYKTASEWYRNIDSSGIQRIGFTHALITASYKTEINSQRYVIRMIFHEYACVINDFQQYWCNSSTIMRDVEGKDSHQNWDVGENKTQNKSARHLPRRSISKLLFSKMLEKQGHADLNVQLSHNVLLREYKSEGTGRKIAYWLYVCSLILRCNLLHLAAFINHNLGLNGTMSKKHCHECWEHSK